MINSVEFDLQAFEATKKEAEKAFQKLGETSARKILIEAANDGLVNALRRHFAMREQEMPKSTGFPWFGQPYPKRYFWRGTRDFPGGLRFAFSKTPDGVVLGVVSPMFGDVLNAILEARPRHQGKNWIEQ